MIDNVLDRFLRTVTAVISTFPLFLGSPANSETLRVYVDADFSVSAAVGDAIQLGLRTALAQGDNSVADITLEVVPLDHRGNPRRSWANLERFDRDPNAIAVFGGMHSPPYLTFGNEINAAGIPLLLPWSAAAPITRMATGDDNFIFRLSVDDSKAGPFLVASAIEAGCERIALLLADTGWGRANESTIKEALNRNSLRSAATIYVPGDIGPAAARNAARDLKESAADCAISVLTTRGGNRVLNAIYEIEADVQVLSHWGVINREFPVYVPFEVREQLHLRILQSCGLDLERAGSSRVRHALETARTLGAEFESLEEISAPAGFVHAYDLGLIFRAAVEQAAREEEWAQGPAGRRQAIRNALQSLEKPVQGILMDYERPFSAVSDANPDGHFDDIFIARN